MASRAIDLALKGTVVLALALIGYSLPTANSILSAFVGAAIAAIALVISAPIRARSAAHEASQSRSTHVGIRLAFLGVTCMALGFLLALSTSFSFGVAVGLLGFAAVAAGMAISRFQLIPQDEKDA